ncbi:MAG TPA: MGMT family protein [Patescibacteria group bacterium]|nr:MGMT family protein [Patescibacteria group bacterium]
MSPFKNRVIEIVRSIPEGKVVSYGQIASYAGLPRAAREVGWVLSGLEGSQLDLPWWRVVNNSGYLSIRGNQTHDKELQAKLLRAENIEVSSDFELDMKKYRYLPTEKELSLFGLPKVYIESLLAKYNL